MRGVVFPGDRIVSYLDVPDPTPGPLDVIVEMKASGMCGTDLQNYRRPRDQPAYMPPLLERPPIQGHEPAALSAPSAPPCLLRKLASVSALWCIIIRDAPPAITAAAAGSSFARSPNPWCASMATTTTAGTRRI